ncbi:MAG TPA: acyl-CoA dehydrogenase family protein [Myxococcota bacterium]|nr:acyl-CoA dehydrogenase family protein [Myxococcota bacterium]
MIDFEPTEEQTLIVETVREFARGELRPRAREADESAKTPSELLARAHELGLVANGLPEEFGGGGARSAVTGALVAEELAWGDLSLALAVLAPSLLGYAVVDFGTAAQKAALLPESIASASCTGTLAAVEPRFDSDVYRPRTAARRAGSEWALDGAKCLVPWLEGVRHILVLAQAEGALGAFAVPSGAAGLTAKPDAYMGVRALPLAELELRDVRVPLDARLGGERGPDVRALVARGRVGLAALGVGVARAAFEVARDYAKERKAFGVPIATKQAIAFKLADMAIEIDGARLLTWEAAWQLDRGLDATREAALAIHQVRRVALEVADGAVQVFGGHGYVREYLPELFLRNARGFACFEALTLV